MQPQPIMRLTGLVFRAAVILRKPNRGVVCTVSTELQGNRHGQDRIIYDIDFVFGNSVYSFEADAPDTAWGHFRLWLKSMMDTRQLPVSQQLLDLLDEAY